MIEVSVVTTDAVRRGADCVEVVVMVEAVVVRGFGGGRDILPKEGGETMKWLGLLNVGDRGQERQKRCQ